MTTAVEAKPEEGRGEQRDRFDTEAMDVTSRVWELNRTRMLAAGFGDVDCRPEHTIIIRVDSEQKPPTLTSPMKLG
jgi:hypothetical protein